MQDPRSDNSYQNNIPPHGLTANWMKFNQPNLMKFDLHVTSILPMKFWVKWPFGFRKKKSKKIFKIAAMQGSGKLENSQSGPKIRIPDWFQTPKNAHNLVKQVCAVNTIFPQPINFHESMMSKKSQTVKSSQTDNVSAPFKCLIMVNKRL